MPTPEHPDHVLQAAAQHLPMPLPQATLLWTAAVHSAPREALGNGPLGGRAIVPILGGVFWGGPGHAALHGTVRSGGADRQLVRADGIKELRAEYEMQAPMAACSRWTTACWWTRAANPPATRCRTCS